MKRILGTLIFGFFTLSLLAAVAWAGAEQGQVPSAVELKGKLGGRLDGAPWSSEELRGKVHVLFYVDPDEKDTNNETSEALEKEKFPSDRFQSVAVINMAATFMPNFLISSSLKEKQEKYPRTLYVRDYKKALVNEWGLADNSSDILGFDKQGRVIFRKDGKLTMEEIQQLIKIIKESL
ncbi:MAG: transcriptional regulator [Deltaproteobacteria bacterium]|nr:transcriptional regulator [Deltaproteobacteria bacterium]